MTPIDSALLTKVALPVRGANGAAQTKLIADIGPIIQSVMVSYEINTFLREAHFLAQLCHESDNFVTCEEYASGAAYEGRIDLGNAQPGDGRRYKGRGLIQLTGRKNYRAIGSILGLPLEDQPELAMVPENAVKIACEFWKSRSINVACDRHDIVAVTRKVNGGTNGLESRRNFLQRAEAALGGTQADLLTPRSETHIKPSHSPGRGVVQPISALRDRHSAAQNPLPPLRTGTDGAAVSRLQRMLRHKGYRVTPDGVFGPQTDRAVRRFQQALGLLPDGIVGRQTWWRLASGALPAYHA